jgi:hypothetical protein
MLTKAGKTTWQREVQTLDTCPARLEIRFCCTLLLEMNSSANLHSCVKPTHDFLQSFHPFIQAAREVPLKLLFYPD